MSTNIPNTFSRRDFLRTSALAGGGMLIGFNLITACKEKAEMPVDIASLNFNDFNAFIKIADNGYVTIYSPNPEIGQGVKTSMPMIIAEELDVPWDHVNVEQGKLDTENFQRQVAGGSQSIRFGWDALRQTGATTRQMLVNAAAARWGVEASTCSTKQGVITNAKGETLGYGDVVKEAAALEVPEGVTLKEPKDYTIIGHDAVNVDIEKIVTGKPLFGLDYKKEGMLYAAILRPPSFGKKLVSFDDTEAKKVDGVTDVVRFGEKAIALRSANAWVAGMLGQSDKIAVVATSTWQAMKGRDALKAVWEDGSPMESTEGHDDELIKILDGSNLNTLRKDGDVKKAFAKADATLERTYESPFLPHACMEPMNFFADVTADKVHLVGPIQTPAGTAQSVAGMLGRDPKDIHLEMTRMGGGFGRRLYGDFAIEAAELSAKINKPVKMVCTREDDIGIGVYRPGIKYRIKAGVKDGKVTSYHLKEACINSNMYGLIPHFFPAGAIENYQVDAGNYKSNITTGAWRAPYTHFLAFAEQAFFDELAEMMEIDPVQLRLDLLQNVKGHKDENIQYEPKRMEDVINLAVEKSGYRNKKDGVFQGFCAYYCHNTHVAEVADVVIENDKPVVKKVTVAVDCGIVVNPTGAKNQIEGGVIDGIGHAMYGDLSFSNGTPNAQNYDKYRLIRMKEAPEVETHFVENELSPTGLGEPALPPAVAAIAIAINQATGKRLYKQPFANKLEVKELIG
ncbi:xanthine dehydrogenase family protein molybdopterin-binding subunit [Spongiivirga citrea]|uniref:Molybdopterin-dependent oxidoreductase n=1 Tax=Spongiivirga citrea TaxID=1481457 RepID=A0A6M0CQT2_9FLAO|nr:molybdopterin cofactor-binding domain-containing protein [Spongiivirga citrea]NER16290.1 molybdopterin-dependent oxidoreductase [Spongiivirga citrea]